jgi:hypothetical protein
VFLLPFLFFPQLGKIVLLVYALMGLGTLLSLYTAVALHIPDSSGLAAIVYICVVIAFPDIDAPLVQPARKKEFREGGSYDFFIFHKGRKYLIRPSYNYLEGQLDGYKADVLFLGIAGISKDTEARRERFFAETVGKTEPKVVVPVHWDNFLRPLYGGVKIMSGFIEDTGKAMGILAEYCERAGVSCVVQLPLTGAEF